MIINYFSSPNYIVSNIQGDPGDSIQYDNKISRQWLKGRK